MEVLFKELVRKPRCTSGAFKISRIKCLRLSCSPTLIGAISLCSPLTSLSHHYLPVPSERRNERNECILYRAEGERSRIFAHGKFHGKFRRIDHKLPESEM